MRPQPAVLRAPGARLFAAPTLTLRARASALCAACHVQQDKERANGLKAGRNLLCEAVAGARLVPLHASVIL
jgi:hypothetical protein